jgi:HEAT repeat protein
LVRSCRESTALAGPSAYRRNASAAALLRLDRHVPQAVEACLASLTSRSGSDRFQAAKALRELTERNADAVPKLREALASPSLRVRAAAAAADGLARIGSKAAAQALPALEKMSRDDADLWVRQVARAAVARLRAGEAHN